MSGSELETFNLAVVLENFQKSLYNDDDINLKSYLASYDELNKFFLLLGSIFGFVSKDLQEKMGILNEHINNDSINFNTCKTMIEHEKNNGLLQKKGYVSGSRTLLRLHRGLDFIRLFLKNVSEAKSDDSMAQISRASYEQTLAKYHSFLIVQGAKLAMYTMPSKNDLFLRVCGDEENIKKALEILPETLETTAVVYDRVEQLYTAYDLHSLPIYVCYFDFFG